MKKIISTSIRFENLQKVFAFIILAISSVFTTPLGRLSVALCFIFACSCNKSPLAQYGVSFEQIMKSDTALFRGLCLGNSIETIKSLEHEGLQEEDDDDGVNFLFYELAIDSTTSYTLAYYCPNDTLNNIEVAIYLKNEPEGAALFNTFKNYFEIKYGAPQTDGDFFLWTADTRLGKARIALADESPTYKRGKLTLIFHDARY